MARKILTLNASTFEEVWPTISFSNSSGNFVSFDPFNKDVYLYGVPTIYAQLIAINTESHSIVAKIPVPSLQAGLVEEERSFVYNPKSGDIYATEINPQHGTVGLLHISASSNMVVSQTFPPNIPLNYISLDAKDGMLCGAHNPGTSTIYGLDLRSGAATAIEVGTCQIHALLP